MAKHQRVHRRRAPFIDDICFSDERLAKLAGEDICNCTLSPRHAQTLQIILDKYLENAALDEKSASMTEVRNTHGNKALKRTEKLIETYSDAVNDYSSVPGSVITDAIGIAASNHLDGRTKLDIARKVLRLLKDIHDGLGATLAEVSKIARPKARTIALGQLIAVYEDITGRKTTVGYDPENDVHSGPFVRFIHEFAGCLPDEPKRRFLKGAADEAKRLISEREERP